MCKLEVRTLSPGELSILTELFDYNDVEAMIAENAWNIEQGIIDIFGLFEDSALLGELHVMYQSEDNQAAVLGKRAYLFAFRVHEDFQGRGLGRYLLKNVINYLKEKGYIEFTIGVEDDNARAIHIYRQFGFSEVIARRREEYQGDFYEYNLYLSRFVGRKNMTVRKAGVEDSSAICKISGDDLGYECDESLVVKRLTELNHTREAVFVAESEGNVVGYVHAEIYNTLYCESLVNILGLAVSSEYRRQGIGRALMSQAENWAKELGISKVRLNSGISRKGAHAFYRAVGYDDEKVQIRFIKNV